MFDSNPDKYQINNVEIDVLGYLEYNEDTYNNILSGKYISNTIQVRQTLVFYNKNKLYRLKVNIVHIEKVIQFSFINQKTNHLNKNVLKNYFKLEIHQTFSIYIYYLKFS